MPNSIQDLFAISDGKQDYQEAFSFEETPALPADLFSFDEVEAPDFTEEWEPEVDFKEGLDQSIFPTFNKEEIRIVEERKPTEFQMEDRMQRIIDAAKAEQEQDRGFTTALAQAENSIKAGWDGQVWTPHGSLEGGTPTIAYGHKLTPKEVQRGRVKIGDREVNVMQGLSEQDAQALLQQDVEKAKKKAQSTIKDFNSFPKKYQNIITNIVFNTGSVTEKGWPSMLAAMRRGDDEGVKEEMVTSYRTPEGERVVLQERADLIAKAVGI